MHASSLCSCDQHCVLVRVVPATSANTAIERHLLARSQSVFAREPSKDIRTNPAFWGITREPYNTKANHMGKPYQPKGIAEAYAELIVRTNTRHADNERLTRCLLETHCLRVDCILCCNRPRSSTGRPGAMRTVCRSRRR